jgi:hypothetical protein
MALKFAIPEVHQVLLSVLRLPAAQAPKYVIGWMMTVMAQRMKGAFGLINSTDEGGLWADKGSVCSVGVGICEAYGTKICDSGSPSGPTVCSATPGTPTTEICDNYLDDDCDGLTDLDDPDCPS